MSGGGGGHRGHRPHRPWPPVWRQHVPIYVPTYYPTAYYYPTTYAVNVPAVEAPPEPWELYDEPLTLEERRRYCGSVYRPFCAENPTASYCRRNAPTCRRPVL